MTRFKILLIAGLLTAGWAGMAPARAQDGPLTLYPPLTDIFPLENLPDGVHLTCPVMINDHTVLSTKAVLRFIFLDPNGAAHANAPAGSVDGGPGFRKNAGGGSPMAGQSADDNGDKNKGQVGGWGTVPDTDATGLFDARKEDAKRRKSELENEVWNRKDLFVDALEHATELGTVLVYTTPAQAGPQTTSFDLPEGMLLGEVGGQVRVLGLEESSRPFAAGIRPGDEIRSFHDGVPLKTLTDFMREYLATKHQARVTGNTAYGMEIWRPSSSQALSIQIAAPASIPSFLNDTYTTAPQDKKP